MLKKVKDNFKFLAQRLWKDESAQGATEYILLLVVIVGMVVAFGPQISQAVQDKMKSVKDMIMNVGT